MGGKGEGRGARVGTTVVDGRSQAGGQAGQRPCSPGEPGRPGSRQQPGVRRWFVMGPPTVPAYGCLSFRPSNPSLPGGPRGHFRQRCMHAPPAPGYPARCTAQYPEYHSESLRCTAARSLGSQGLSVPHPRHSADKAMCLLSRRLASLSAPGGRQACDPTGEAGRGAKGVLALYGVPVTSVFTVLELNWSR